jgi:hypothetical protein
MPFHYYFFLTLTQKEPNTKKNQSKKSIRNIKLMVS